MNRMRMFVVSSVFFVAGLSVAAPATQSAVESVRALKLPSEFRSTQNQSLSANYADTECFDVAMVKSGEILGVVCASKSRDFLKDMGISEFDSLPEGARPTLRPSSGLLVSTPMAQYEMKALKNAGQRTFAAEVDCDAGTDPVYRATATCHVAVAKRGLDEVVYTNFTLKNHVSKKKGASSKLIQSVWGQLCKE